MALFGTETCLTLISYSFASCPFWYMVEGDERHLLYDFSLTDIERSENSKAQRHLNIQQNWESKY